MEYENQPINILLKGFKLIKSIFILMVNSHRNNQYLYVANSIIEYSNIYNEYHHNDSQATNK